MRRIAVGLLALALPMLAQQEGVTPRSTTERPNVSAPGMDQTLTGLLMDASCRAIADGRSDLTQMPSSSRTPDSLRQDGQTGANAQSTLGETARTQTEQESRALKVYTPQPSASPDRASASGTTGAAASAAPAAGARTDADDRLPRKTEGGSTVVGQNAGMRRLTEADRSRAASGPSNASATGTTGAATETAPATQSGEVQSLSSAGTGASGQTSERSLPGSTSASASGGTVREKYQGCMVKPSTTSFAIHADGKLFVLDRASNQMVQEQMRNEAFRASMSNQKDMSQWMTVTVQGTPTSDNVLTIRSVRK